MGADTYGYGGPGQNGLGGGADEEDVAFSKLPVRDRLRTFNAPPSARMHSLFIKINKIGQPLKCGVI